MYFFTVYIISYKVCLSKALQDETEMQRCSTPSSWAYLTISDKNLCSFISRGNTALEIHTLDAQLKLTLDQNLQKAANLDQAVAMNNSGLPFDWVKDAQPKKQRSRVAPKESNFVAQVGAPARLINIRSTNPQGGVVMGSEKADENQILKALSSSPHIILCCPRNGSVSYVLLNSTLSGGLGKVTGDSRGDRVGERGEERMGERGLGEGGRSDPTKSTIRLDGTRCTGAPPDVSSPRTTAKGGGGPKGKARVEPTAQASDYDLTQFSNFASRLVDVDPLQGFGRLEGPPLENFNTPQMAGDEFLGRKNLPRVSKPSAATETNIPGISGAEEEVMETHSSVRDQLPPLSRGTSTQGNAPQSTQQRAVPGAHSNWNPVGCVMTEREMADLPLNLDPESLRELFKLPISPEMAAAGGNEGEETGNHAARKTNVTLSPLSELMQSLVPTSQPEGEGEFGGYSFPSTSTAGELGVESDSGRGIGGRGHGGSGSITPSCVSDGRDGGGYMDTPADRREDLSSDYAQYLSGGSSSLTHHNVFPEQSLPLMTESYQWEDLLHSPSSYPVATPTSVQSHSHTAIPHSPQAQPVSHTNSFHSHTPSLHSASPHSHVSGRHSVPTSHSQPHPSSHTTEQLCTDDHLVSLLDLTPDKVSLLTSQLLGTTTGATHSLQESDSPVEIHVASSEGLPMDENQHNQIFTPGSLFPPPPHQPLPSPSHPHPSPVSSPNPLPFPAPSNVARTATILDGGSLPSPSLPRGLSDIPEGVPMDMLLDPLDQHLQGANNLMDPSASFSLSSYRKSSTPSSPSISSVSGHSTVSSLFDPGGESPSVLELCELLSESPSVQKHDFSNMTFTGIYIYLKAGIICRD